MANADDERRSEGNKTGQHVERQSDEGIDDDKLRLSDVNVWGFIKGLTNLSSLWLIVVSYSYLYYGK
jgi:hypothetical protein